MCPAFAHPKWHAPKLDHWIFSAIWQAINNGMYNIDIGTVAQAISTLFIVVVLSDCCVLRVVHDNLRVYTRMSARTRSEIE